MQADFFSKWNVILVFAVLQADKSVCLQADFSTST
jgi:hypothetical protein